MLGSARKCHHDSAAQKCDQYGQPSCSHSNQPLVHQSRQNACRVSGGRGSSFADAADRVVEPGECLLRVVPVVIPERHRHVAAVPADEDVFELGVVGQAVERQMGLDEPAMPLRLQHRNHFVEWRRAGVEPWAHLPRRLWEGLVREQQAGDDRLGPCRARFQRRGDDDVVGARPERIPPRAVEMVVLIGPDTFWQHGHRSAPLEDRRPRPATRRADRWIDRGAGSKARVVIG